jgi:hypothetical protein
VVSAAQGLFVQSGFCAVERRRGFGRIKEPVFIEA